MRVLLRKSSILYTDVKKIDTDIVNNNNDKYSKVMFFPLALN